MSSSPHNVYVTGVWAFIPSARGPDNKTVYYIKVPSCVVYVDCLVCKAKAGERCLGDRGPTLGVHIGRKKRARALLERTEPPIHNCGPMRLG